MPKSKEKPPAPGDVLANLAAVRLAQQQRLIASWLPPRNTDDAKALASAKTREEEEEEIFKPTPELLGLGATAPKDWKDGLPTRKDATALEKLRVQLLGKKAAERTRSQNTTSMPKSKPITKTPTKTKEDFSDEDDGRALAVTSKKNSNRQTKRSRAEATPLDLHQNTEAVEDDSQETMPSSSVKDGKRKATSFLDEVLAEKARKKKKKKKSKSEA